jgi:hypothetical protein
MGEEGLTARNIASISLFSTASKVQWSELLATDPEARVRFPALPGKKIVGLERGPLGLLSTTEELLDRKVADPVYKTENTAVGIRHADHVPPTMEFYLSLSLSLQITVNSFNMMYR